MTSQESELAWWHIMWGTENAKFRGHGHGGPSGTLNTTITHQASCGHGLSWLSPVHSIYPVSPHRVTGEGKGGFGGSSLGSSPSEYQHRWIRRR